MKNELVYDLPVRLFHWIFAGLFVVTFLIAKTVDDESPDFAYHMLAGLLLVFTVVLRIVWGFTGSQNSRFSSFALRPQELVAYFTGILAGDKRRWVGHNPASSWATLAMFALALGLGTTGFLMASGEKEGFKDVHELLANGFLVVVLLHVAGVISHGFRHRDGIALAMVHGKKMGVSAQNAIQSSRPAVAFVFVLLVLGFVGHLFRNFDQTTNSLQLFGATLTIGDNHGDEEHEEHDDHDDD